MPADLAALAQAVVTAAGERGLTVGTAESVTGGLVCSTLVGVPGASAVVLGGVVAYDVAVKHAVLGVPQRLLDADGPVSGTVAMAMAEGAARVLGTDIAVATTGVAGPQWHDGKPPGSVVIAIAGRGLDRVDTWKFEGDRQSVRASAAATALDQLARALAEVAQG